MTLDEFVTKYKGQKIEFDGKYEFQCVDLTKLYNKEVIAAPTLMGNAIDYLNNPLPAFYEFKTNPLWYIPPRGAIAIWNNKVGGGFGHVAIILSASLLQFRSLDQNWPTGAPVTEVDHVYKDVAGFLVPRAQDILSKYNALVDDLRALSVRYPKL